MMSHRVQGLVLMGVVFVIVVVVLTSVQAAQHDWFIYKGTYSMSSDLSGSCRCLMLSSELSQDLG